MVKQQRNIISTYILHHITFMKYVIRTEF